MLTTLPDLTVKTFFTDYSWRVLPCTPEDSLEHFSKWEYIVMKVAQVALAVISFGIIPLVCYLLWGRFSSGVREIKGDCPHIDRAAQKALNVGDGRPVLGRGTDEVDPQMLHFLINDFAGGGEGASQDRMV